MKTSATILEDSRNDAAIEIPYIADVAVEGTTSLLFHRWSIEDVEEKSKSMKGSNTRKTDNVETYVYRNPKGNLCIPSEYFRMSIIAAAKFKQDPRSPRKSAMDLFKAGIVCLDEFCDLGVKDWDYLDRRRVIIQRSAITRQRPAMNKGWTVKVQLQVLLPEYINPTLLNETIQAAGRLVGVGDFRPTYGRFVVTGFKIL